MGLSTSSSSRSSRSSCSSRCSLAACRHLSCNRYTTLQRNKPLVLVKAGQAFVVTAFGYIAVGPLMLTHENNWFMGKEPVFPNKLLYMTFISVGLSYSKMHLKWFRLFTVYAGPGSSAGRPAPANRSHHPAAADCLSFRKQSARQHTGQHFFTSFITDLTDLICKCALNFNASFCSPTILSAFVVLSWHWLTSVFIFDC